VAEVLITMITFTLVYGVLAVVEVRLLLGRIGRGLPDVDEAPESTPEPAFAY
jgi:hypothetical protein